MYAISLPGRHQLMNEEGLRLRAYYCAAGKLTNGYGHRVAAGEPLEITKEQAGNLLDADLKRFEAEINTLAKYIVNQQQFDALVIFVYNIGIGAFRASTARRDIIDGKLNGVPYEIKRWVHDDHGHVIPGLVSRQNRTALLFAEGKYA